MKLHYSWRSIRTTTAGQAGPLPSVRRVIKSYLSRFVKSRWKAIFPLAGIIVGVYLIEQMGWFEHLQGAAADAFSRGMTHQVPKDVLIVEITDQEYKSLFGERSPLHPDSVLKLVDSVRQLDPAVIGVDLDTRDREWACTPMPDFVLAPNSKVIWAQVPNEDQPGPKTVAENSASEESEPIALGPVLGGMLRRSDRMGVVRFPQDSDGFVRTFRTEYAVKNQQLPAYSNAAAPRCDVNKQPREREFDKPESVSPTMPSFFDAVAHRASIGLPRTELDRQYLKFSGDRYNFQIVQAGEFIHLMPPTAPEKTTGNVAVPKVTRTPIPPEVAAKMANRIVLIGGTYGAGRDEYVTAMGKMAGIELLANGVETELQKSITYVWPPLLITLDVLAGILIVWIYYELAKRPLLALTFSVAAMIGVVIVGAFFYYGLGSFLNFVPVMFGMVLHQMYEETKEAVELQHELKRKNSEIEDLRKQLAQARHGADSVAVSDVPGATKEAGPILRTTVVEAESARLSVDLAQTAPPRKRGKGAAG